MDKVETIKNRLLADIPGTLARYLPGGRTEGTEYVVRNPTRADSSAGSFKINIHTGRWADFATQDKGDILDLVAYVTRRTIKEIVADSDPTPPRPIAAAPKPAPAQEWTILPLAETQPPAEIIHPKKGRPTTVYRWETVDGRLIGFTARFDFPDGSKEILPYVNARRGARIDWVWKLWSKPRPLYGLPALAEKPGARVLIVEGEKCRDAAAAALPEFAVVTWAGGTQGAKFAHWDYVRGRDVLIWPDADAPGIQAAKTIAEAIPGAKILALPAGLPVGYDVADALRDGRDLAEFLNPPQQKPETPKRKNSEPFRPLGTSGGSHFFATDRDVLSFSMSALGNKTILLHLAPLNYWEAYFPGAKSNVDWTCAQDYVIEKSRALPPFDPNLIRGRGAWSDAGRSVVHLGDRLLVDGAETTISDFETKYHYTHRPRLATPSRETGTAADGAALAEILDRAQWGAPHYAKLAAGWLFIAPIVGALRWRPHVWITGGRGTGKSWLLNNIFARYLENVAIAAQGDTTEAGLRQTLGSDSLPVLFDEFEARDARAADRINTILGLLRAASTETGAQVIKGGSGGSVSSAYQVRTAACCVSVDVSATQSPDTSRFSILSLVPRNSRDDFNNLKATVFKTITPEFCARLHSRAYRDIPRVRAIIEVFANVGAPILGDQRTADQVGTLFAGFWALTRDDIPTEAEAAQFFDAPETIRDADDEGDEIQALRWLLSSTIRAEGVGDVATISERPVGELLETALGMDTRNRDEATVALRRIGIVVSKNDRSFWVSGRNPALAKIFAGKPWTRWARVLARLPGAIGNEPRRYNGGVTERGTIIPYLSLTNH